MRRFKILVFSQAVPGQEDVYDEWYSRQHLGDVCAVPGFVSGQRFVPVALGPDQQEQRNLAIYELEADDPLAAIAQMAAQAGSPAMPVSPALDAGSVTMLVYEEATGKVWQKGREPA